MAAKPSIPKGTRDFSPVEMAKRNYIFNTIREVYHLYGFRQIETPSMEMLSTLMGKYGEEGDKLLYKILDSGDFLSNFTSEIIEVINELIKEVTLVENKLRNDNLKKQIFLDKISFSDTRLVSGHYYNIIREMLLNNNLVLEKESGTLDLKEKVLYKKVREVFQLNSKDILTEVIKKHLVSPNVGKEKGLRYDLTVPFARYVVMHREEISFPFKRYQIQPVWRADRPQKGRYREFYQCDADVVGSDSLLNEVELMQIIDTVFTRFQIRVCIKINNRKILSGIAEIIGESDKIVDITVAIDKLDKIGLENVNKELAAKGISEEAIRRLQPIILLQGSSEEKLATLKSVLAESETGLKGVEESEFIFSTLAGLGLRNAVELDLTLARGLNYYTGAIFEVKALDVQIGSITGGGRYDNLTGVFGMPGVSGVGISFGADRIFDVLNQLELYPKEAVNSSRLLFVNFGDKEMAYSMEYLQKVRQVGICAEIYPDVAKMKKQMSYANNKQIPFVAMAGENEMEAGKITLKNMESGEQSLVSVEELIAAVRK